jgi:hypothetical protein
MSNDKTITKRVQEQIFRFGRRITKGLKKSRRRFISQMIYGIQASRDIKISNICRSLDEEIKLIKTEQRLSRQLSTEDLTDHFNESVIKEGANKIKRDTVLAWDLSDIQKPFAKKMDLLSEVWDGSEKEVGLGYCINSVIAADVREGYLIPLYSELYSHKAKDFGSENQQIFKALGMVNKQLKGRGIWAMDRGADRREIVEELGRLKARYVIRCRGDRLVETRQGRWLSIREIVERTRSNRRYKVTVDEQGHKEEKEIMLGIRKDVKVEGIRMDIVVVRGFGQKPLMLMTNVDKEPEDILDIYLTRWKCEESFRFLKQEYHLEDVRVRSYTGLRNTIAIMHAVFYFLSVYLHRSLRVNILLEKILEKAKRFFEVPVFKYYAIADGIYRLLFNQKWAAFKPPELDNDRRQLTLAFD